ncbi:MAG: glucose-1-phosphate cytidylyltransferase [Deltaproteobacteria bacterium DG_8]|nr:MAG: glucose-1-phosphate cytidylyltransferase [Deltaproteobacteria bacterium DG_8]
MERLKKEKVVILCGGRGTRIREETEFRPKPMVEIGYKPILWHIMKIYSFFGFTDFILCLGYKGEMIKEYFLNYEIMNSDFTIELGSNRKGIQIHSFSSKDQWRVTLADTGYNTMTGARLKRIESYIERDNFMMTYGDGVANIDLNKLWEFHLSHKRIATITGVRPPSRFGELVTSGNRVNEFSEKPQIREGYINGGFFVLNRKVFNYLKDDENCSFEREPLEKLALDGELMIFFHNDYWHCMDTLRDLDILEEEWKKKNPSWKIWK